MPKIIEAVYENGVFKPLQKVDLKEGERVKIKLELKVEPIDLGEPVSVEEIKKIRDGTWMSS
ncbi:antitoxin family protein [Archaeoglobus fulgidus]|jgi:predicted DNA-binding antitoxin AbrB/MazE fold protein|uniref:Putative antitoxin VapB21 n=3 Tax=Archaeoglobus fulgidus TaxID=2234 RepID=VPB21_ARCFU|nr:antitoxin family protein [Archaeoglobus fulgidus]O28071.1 RecName: Full=Putative antitoxin VapB21 [Archaeoglobus fulgidus DSM 4304]AAB89054.1 conserved hypothetical protein [Archaeoglobus fulgidus DSM 4304]KUJ93615.1 MAG: Putative antitoxin VapB21 [Archaeoglobus fulgidus]KUK07324.1 MAG: Putative antitoxin VapB21 [Archaeoglobus fulgidus]